MGATPTHGQIVSQGYRNKSTTALVIKVDERINRSRPFIEVNRRTLQQRTSHSICRQDSRGRKAGEAGNAKAARLRVDAGPDRVRACELILRP